MNKIIILLFLIVALIITPTQSRRIRNNYVKPDKESRNFIEWMNTVPDTPPFGKGLKALIVNMNPSLSEAESLVFTQEINEAAKDYPDFCNSGNDDIDKSEFSAFLSIVGAETSFNTAGGFPQTIENGCPNCQACSYDTRGRLCDNNTKLQYFGRGPLQLSWNYNYADFSKYIFKDENILLNDPSIVTSTGAMSWSSAIWFWMVDHDFGGWCMPPAAWPGYHSCEEKCTEGPAGCSDPQCTQDHWLPRGFGSCHKSMISKQSQGIGEVINLINGGYDCCASSSYGYSYGHTTFRVWWYMDAYQRWTNQLPLSPLNPVPINYCPLAKSMNCQRLSPGPCWASCCSL